MAKGARAKTRQKQPANPTIYDVVEGVTEVNLREIDTRIRHKNDTIAALQFDLALLQCERKAIDVKLHGLPMENPSCHVTATYTKADEAASRWRRFLEKSLPKSDAGQEPAGK